MATIFPTAIDEQVTEQASDGVNILMVDDQPANLLALEAVLEPLGHNLVRANSGIEALKRLLQDEFAVILLDVFMPDMDGFETASLIRQREKTRSTPIVFLTAMGKSELEVFRGYSVGAIDYLFKPIVAEILRSKVAAFVDLFQKSQEVKRQAEQLRQMQRREQEAKLAEAQRQLDSERRSNELRIARAIQQRLFPRVPPACESLEFWGASYPADATGGDYFDYIHGPQSCIDVVIGDVSGHGYGSALLMATTRAYLRALALTRSDAGEIVALANQALAADIADEQFITLFFARLDPSTRSFTYVNAGHPPGYVLNAAGEVLHVLESTSMPLGIVPDGDFPTAKITLAPGDIIFLHTDGIPEAGAPENAFGDQRALDVVLAHRHLDPQAIVEALYSEVNRFLRGQPHGDDLSALIIKCR